LSNSIVARWAYKCHGYDDCFIAHREPCDGVPFRETRGECRGQRPGGQQI
jgi:hypothetical protein